MTQTMTRSKVQNIPMPDLEQTAAQSPGKMLQISSRQQDELERGRERTRAGKLHQTEAPPADSEVQSQVNKDGSACSRKTVHSNK